MGRLEQLEELLAHDPKDPFLYFALAMELIKNGRSEEALARFDGSLALDPEYVAAYHHKGQTLAALGRADEARAVLHAGIETARRVGNAHAAEEMQELLHSVA